MPNQYINEVIYNGQTLIDLQNDTVAPNKVLAGETFHDRSGAPQQGSLITHNVYDGLDSTSTSDALSANQGKILSENITSLINKTPTSNAFTEILISAGSDLNNYTTCGTYIVPNDSIASQINNIPRAASGRLVVINRTNTNYIRQEYYPTTSTITVYVRNYNSGSWTNWDSLALISHLENKVSGPASSTNNAVAIFDGTDGKTIKNSGFTLGKSVPNNAVFTDTWRPVVDNLTSADTDKSLSANQGKILNSKITEIKKKTVTGTTNSNGSVSISFSKPSIILSVFAIGKGDVCVVPCANGSGTQNGSETWWVACRNVDTWNAYANTALNLCVVYIEP